jgi:hypothetical protein
MAIAAFLFLRLVNPAIIFPNQYGLVDTAPNTPGLTRQLILITKVMQNLVRLTFLFVSLSSNLDERCCLFYRQTECFLGTKNRTWFL